MIINNSDSNKYMWNALGKKWMYNVYNRFEMDQRKLKLCFPENPIPTIRTIMLMTSRLMPSRPIIPTTPTSTEMIVKVTQITHI